jgi:hypothetical protein
MQWKYKTLKLGTTGFLGGKLDTAALGQGLNKLGSQGWEIVAAFDTNESQGRTRDVVLIFKRQRS